MNSPQIIEMTKCRVKGNNIDYIYLVYAYSSKIFLRTIFAARKYQATVFSSSTNGEVVGE